MTATRDVLKEALMSQFDFHFDATRRLLELVHKLSAERFSVENPDSSSEIQAAFIHLLGADRFWREILTGSIGMANERIDETSLVGLIAWIELERVRWRGYMADLDDSKLAHRIERDLPFGTFSFT